MRKQFDDQLRLLNDDLIRMGAMCEEGISAAAKAMLDENAKLAIQVSEVEVQIDEIERSIEALCMQLLLQQQPVASDLRQISSALKMISDMERIGDLAEDIAELVPYVGRIHDCNREDLSNMARMAIGMVTDSVDSFVRRDIELARRVMNADDGVDNLFDSVKKQLIAQITAKPEDGESLMDLVMVAKYLERIADHATNIAEWVVYSLTGVHPHTD